MTTMLFERVGAVLVLVHGAKDPSDHEWNAYVRAADEMQHSGAPITGLLVTSFGGAPNAGQRKAIVAVADLSAVVTCVCTNSVVARGVITAIRWLSDTPMHGLLLDDLDNALQIMGVPHSQCAEVKAAVQRLQSQLS
jgi:hypothetical protein